MAILETVGLKKYYDIEGNITKALDGIDFKAEKGEFVAIVGSSGSGKTTFLNMVGGLDEPTEGKIYITGTEISKMPKEERTIFRRRKVGFIFQNYNLIPFLKVYDNILLSLKLDDRNVDKKLFHNIISILGLDTQLEKRPNQLSGGQQQRVAIARALISKPAIVLADEPTGNLDSQTSQDVMRLLKVTNTSFNQTVIMITHNNQIAQLADRIVRIEDGKIYNS